MDQQEIMGLLKKAGKFSELYEVRAFVGTRTDAQGEEREVSVQMLDAGPDAEERFIVIAEDEAGRIAEGDLAKTIDEAITNTHWHELDEEVDEEEEEE
jgi:hypothetical protein